MKSHIAFALACLAVNAALAQHPWPVTPFDQSHEITGTFCEYRDTSPAGHFHNGTDIPKADGSPVYPVRDGRVVSMSAVGSDAFVRVDDLAYVHIAPSPLLAVGDSVFTSTTVLGTILSGLGHVHFTDGYFDSERNGLRQGGGLTPYNDPWPPQISNVRFYQFETRAALAATALSGNVEITMLVREANGPPSTSESRRNNGAYIAGYQVLTRDRSTIVYSPSAGGVQFRFDLKPDDGLVGNVFDQTVASTSSHVYRVTNQVARATPWNTMLVPEGDYTVMVFAGDTRDNADTVYVDVTVTRQDLVPPSQPLFLAALDESAQQRFLFRGGNEIDLQGFRLYQSGDNSSWQTLADETVLSRTSTEYVDNANGFADYFYMTTVDTAAPPNESFQSDVYGVAPDSLSRRVLIVDGFDRTENSGSWHSAWHDFVYVHATSLNAAGVGFDACANDALLSRQVSLLNYDAVFWLLGDESTRDETFSRAEQLLVQSYLESGGKLFVSGSEIAWDLEGSSNASSSDRAFLHDYLKVAYAGDDANNLTVRGAAGGIFDGIAVFGYGTRPYVEDWPDYFTPRNGSEAALHYGNGLIAGVQYEGTFGNGTIPAQLVILGFPFETISTASVRDELIARVVAFFFPGATGVRERTEGAIPASFVLRQNYPNPFSARALEASQSKSFGTTVEFSLPALATVEMTVFDVLGRMVYRSAPQRRAAGEHALTWDGKNASGVPVARGTYFLRLVAEGQERGKNQRWNGEIKVIVR